MRALLELGADPTARTQQGYTARQLAIAQKKQKVVAVSMRSQTHRQGG